MLPLFLCREFVWLIPWCLHFYAGNFSYTSQPAFIFKRVVSLTYPMQASFYAGSFSYTSRVDFFFMWGVCVTHPVLASCLCGEFLLHLPYWLFFFFLDVRSFFLLQSTLKTIPYEKDSVEAGPSEIVWKSRTQTRKWSPRTTWTEQNKTKQGKLRGEWTQEWTRKKKKMTFSSKQA